MPLVTRSLLVLAVIGLAAGCRHTARTPPPPPPPAPLAAGTLLPSPRLIVGRIISVDAARRFAFIELSHDAPPAALAAGTEFVARTLDLHETARVQASAFVRGRTLGAKILGGQPSPGDEVVWLAP